MPFDWQQTKDRLIRICFNSQAASSGNTAGNEKFDRQAWQLFGSTKVEPEEACGFILFAAKSAPKGETARVNLTE